MRKWMRDRLQRRKQSPAAPSDQPAPPPLQPAYFEAGEASDEASDAEPMEAVEVGEAAAQPHAARDAGHQLSEDGDIAEPAEDLGDSTSAPAPSSRTSSSREVRGRRRRGGRGRGGRGREQAVAAAFAPAAVKGSIPAVHADTGDDESPEAEGAGELPDQPAERSSEPTSQAAAAAIPAAPPRPSKGAVVLAIGLPGSGKSSWFKRHNLTPLSSDMVRSLLFDDVREQRFQDLVFSNLRSMLKARLIAKRPMNYVDATNLTPQERQHWIKLAKDYHYEVHAVFFDVPLEVCVERHQRRDRVVPEDVMRRMAAKLKPPTFEEGFAKITVVRVKKKAEEAAPEPVADQTA